MPGLETSQMLHMLAVSRVPAELKRLRRMAGKAAHRVEAMEEKQRICWAVLAFLAGMSAQEQCETTMLGTSCGLACSLVMRAGISSSRKPSLCMPVSTLMAMGRGAAASAWARAFSSSAKLHTRGMSLKRVTVLHSSSVMGGMSGRMSCANPALRRACPSLAQPTAKRWAPA